MSKSNKSLPTQRPSQRRPWPHPAHPIPPHPPGAAAAVHPSGATGTALHLPCSQRNPQRSDLLLYLTGRPVVADRHTRLRPLRAAPQPDGLGCLPKPNWIGTSTAVLVQARAALPPCPMKRIAWLAPQHLHFPLNL